MGSTAIENGSRGSGEQQETRDSAISLTELWIAVLNNRWLIAMVLLLSVGATAYYTKTRTKLYSAQATIRMDPEAPKPLGSKVNHVAEIESDYWDRQEYYNTEFQMITAKSTALVVVNRLALHRNPGFVSGKPGDETSVEPYVTAEDAAGILQSRLNVSGIKDSRLATVSFSDANPERAARILGEVLNAYMGVHQSELSQITEQAATWLDEQLGELKGRLDKSEFALHNYKKEKKILSVSADDQTEMLRARMAQLTQALTEAETRRARIGARRGELRKIKGDDPRVLPAEELTDSLLLRDLRQKYIASYERVESLRAAGKGEGHPELASALAVREATRSLLLSEVANLKESVEKDYAALNDEIGSLNALFNNAKDQALELNLLAIEYKRLERARNTNQELVDLVTDRSQETGLTRHLRPSNVRIVDHPEVPKFSYFPNAPLNMVGSVFAGLLLGLGLAFGREQLNSTIRRPEVAETVLSMPFLGILPAIKKSKQKKSSSKNILDITPNRSELLVHREPSSGMAEAARAIRTNVILGRDTEGDKKIILVTSASPGDGKTTVACSLAISLAQTGQRVALVDCDLRRPRLHRIFGKPNDAGVSNILSGSLSVAQTEQETMVKKLTLLSSGQPPLNPAEMLHSEAFSSMLRELRARFDRVILDSPPLIPVADAAILATQADATVVVTRAFETKKHTARRAARVLQDVGANAIGVILNAVDFDRGEYRYYQYYDYATRSGRDGDSPYSKRSA